MVNKELLVLLADDDQDDCDLFADALEQLGRPIKLDCAVDGAHLMEKLTSAEKLPDLMFLDMNMPVKTGLECLTEIRTVSKFGSVPIIIFSTSAQNDMIDAAFNGGANLYVKKPDSFRKLRDILDRILRIDKKSLLSRRERAEFLIEI